LFDQRDVAFSWAIFSFVTLSNILYGSFFGSSTGSL
jgi:hypothetical protein